MIARPRSVTSTLPASLILTPRELKQYRRFQAQTTTLPPKTYDRLPTAAQYADFQAWLAKRDSGYFSDTPLADLASCVRAATEKKEEKGKASVCGHALHPTHEDPADRCPVCTVEMHVTYMKALTGALEASGGLVKQRWEATDRDSPALLAWYAGKLAFIKDVCRLENLAQAEEDYGTQEQPQPAADAKTAADAVDIYWASLESRPAIMQSPRKKSGRSVGFDPDTSFERGRDQHYFWHKSPRYEAGGKYSSPSGSDEEDEEEECDEEASTLSSTTSTKQAKAIKHHEEQSDEDASDLEDDDDDESDSEEEDSEYEDDDDDDVDGEGSFIVFEYEEVVVEDAEFIVFED